MKKKSMTITVLLLMATLGAFAQTSKVLVDNEKVKVTEYLSQPGQPVCGKGQHNHPDHLTILLTDAKVKTTYSNGDSQTETFIAGKHLYTVNKKGAVDSFPAEGAFWAKGETHDVVNVSDKLLRFYIVELK